MDRPRFSEMLYERRRLLGYSIGQASRVLRLRDDVLIAFEEGDFEAMPKSGYAQGMLSSYARYLGLDAAYVVEIYQQDLEDYQHDMRNRRRSGSSGRSNSSGSGQTQPYVARRGLLPTSGGPAGDMGSFATTRVRARTADPELEEEDEPYVVEETSVQRRPYTSRTPARTRRNRRSGSSRRSGDVGTMRTNYAEYDDDLSTDNMARPYESASSSSGRKSSRNISQTDRPRVNRRPDSRRRTSRDGRRKQKVGLFADSGRIVVLGLIGVAIALIIILVVSVSSCVSNVTSSDKTVTVSNVKQEQATKEQETESVSETKADTEVQGQTNNNSQAEDQKPLNETGASKSSEATDGLTNSTGDQNSTDDSTSSTETSVSVSVADDAVTWLEVNADGKSDVAETITGPWQKTYVVEDSITIQAGDTTAVSVVRNGRQLQFDSMASGIGTIRVQGSGKKKQTSTTQKDTTGETSETSSTAQTGNASATEEKQSQGDQYVEDQYGSGYSDEYGYEYGGV